MNFRTCAFIFVLLFCRSIVAQQPAPSPPPPPPAPAPTPVTTASPFPSRMIRPPALNAMSTSGAFEPPQQVDPMVLRQYIVQRYALPMYRKPSEKELRNVLPRAAIVDLYATFLKEPDTGIVRLVTDAGCAENSKVVNASERCLKYSFPGAGNSFSFRTESYRIRHLADVTLSSGIFWVTGMLMHAIMVDLGEGELRDVTLASPKLKFLNDFQPDTNFDAALITDNELIKGVERDGLVFRRNLPVRNGHVYILRSIAYQGRLMRSVKGADYNELDFDKRRDVVTTFKVVDMEPDGTVTIVWKKLRSVPSPKMKLPEKVKSIPNDAD